jgi:hypothetical protein
MHKLALLLVIFHLKHFLADYPLQTPYMLGKFKSGWGWIKPLAAHAGIHSAFTSAISAGAGATWRLAIGLAALDFAIHFVMDRIKASPHQLGRWKALSANEMKAVMRGYDPSSGTPISDSIQRHYLRSNKLFWWSLGLDQMVHGLTDLAVCALLVLLI